MITIGIDPHKSSLTAVALTPAGVSVGQLRVAVTKTVGDELLAWAQAWPQRQWAVEGASGLGRGVAQLLAATGATVLDVPAKLAARHGCSALAAPVRPTSPTRRRWPLSPNTTTGCGWYAPKVTR